MKISINRFGEEKHKSYKCFLFPTLNERNPSTKFMVIFKIYRRTSITLNITNIE